MGGGGPSSRAKSVPRGKTNKWGGKKKINHILLQTLSEGINDNITGGKKGGGNP